MAASENEDNDILWCINHDSFPFQKPMMETQVLKQTSIQFLWNLDIMSSLEALTKLLVSILQRKKNSSQFCQ